MIEKRIEVPTDEGVVDGRLFLPEDDGPWPLVVFYMDAFGLRPALTRMAEPLVADGYAVLQPNLYWRVSPFEPFDPESAFQDPEERERILALVHSVKPAQAMADTRALVEKATADEPRIRAERFGSVGYCMGGRVAFVSAEELPDRVAAAASIHGGGLVTDDPDSPHRAVSRIRGELYVGVADEDRSCTPEHQKALREALDSAGVDYRMELYDGARHGFAVPDLPVYDEAAAGRHWARVLELFDSELRPTAAS